MAEQVLIVRGGEGTRMVAFAGGVVSWPLELCPPHTLCRILDALRSRGLEIESWTEAGCIVRIDLEAAERNRLEEEEHWHEHRAAADQAALLARRDHG